MRNRELISPDTVERPNEAFFLLENTERSCVADKPHGTFCNEAELPTEAALAITHAELVRLLTPPRRMLSGAVGIWTVAADGGAL